MTAKKTHKALSVLLSLCMVLSAMPFAGVSVTAAQNTSADTASLFINTESPNVIGPFYTDTVYHFKESYNSTYGVYDVWGYDVYGNTLAGWYQLGDYSYYFNPANGIMQRGWIETNGKWYFTNSDGRMHKGWLQNNTYGNRTYYMSDIDGSMLKGLHEIDGVTYYFSEVAYPEGHLYTYKWVCLDEKWYFTGADGTFVTNQWIAYGDEWCYVGADGAMCVSDVVHADGGYYYVNRNGYRINGWRCFKGVWYFFDPAVGGKATLISENLGDVFCGKISVAMDPSKALSLEGGNVVIRTYNEDVQQKWFFIRCTDGSYIVQSIYNDLYLEVAEGSSDIGANVQIHDGTDGPNQRWVFFRNSDNTYTIYPVSSLDEGTDPNTVLDVNYASVADGTNVSISLSNKGENQKFIIETAHTYDTDCDEDCNECGYVREASEHVFENGFCISCGEWECKLGDVNCDGDITISDATEIQKYLLNLVDLSDLAKLTADVDGNKVYSIHDVTYIQMYIVKLIEKLPAEA